MTTASIVYLDYFQRYVCDEHKDTTSSVNIIDLDDIKFSISLIKVGLSGLLTIKNNQYALSPLQKIEQEAECVTVSDMIKEITSVFGVNLSQLARILGISRATVYNHMNSDDAANRIDDYSELFHLSLIVHERYGNVSNCLKAVLVDGDTLLRHLENNYKDTDAILRVIEHIHNKVPEKVYKEMSASEQKRSNFIYIGVR